MSKFRQAYSFHFWEFEIEPNLILGGCQIFVPFFGPVLQTFENIFFFLVGGGGTDKMPAILGDHSIFVFKWQYELNNKSRCK